MLGPAEGSLIVGGKLEHTHSHCMPASPVAQLCSSSKPILSGFYKVLFLVFGASPQRDREARLPTYLSPVGSCPFSPSLGAHTDFRRQDLLSLSFLSPIMSPQLLRPLLLKILSFNFLFVRRKSFPSSPRDTQRGRKLISCCVFPQQTEK